MIVQPSPESIAQAVATLQRGDLLGLPTETVYGLAADAGNEQAVGKIFSRKGRPSDHPLIVHVADAAGAEVFAQNIPDFAQRLMAAFWPGPLTLIVERKANMAPAAAAGYATIGLRCPSHPVAQALLQAARAAEPAVWGVAAPSANRFGRVSPTQATHVAQEFDEDLLILDGGDSAVGIESTIVDCSRGRPIILRPGHVTAEALSQATDVFVQDFSYRQDDDADLAEAPQAPGTLTAHYAPNATVRLMDATHIQTGLSLLGEQGKNIAVYARTKMHSPSKKISIMQMPDNAQEAAHELFRVLRALDATGVKLIWIEAPPPEPVWDGVRDRLARAAASA